MDAQHHSSAVAGIGARRASGKRTLALTGLALLLMGSLPSGRAQVSVGGHGRNFVAPVTDAQGRKTVLRGDGVRPIGAGKVEITSMRAETYRGAQKDLMVEAPLCLFDTKTSTAWSSTNLSIHTADARFAIQGRAFRWQLGDARLPSLLIISNEVHSLIRKHMLTSTNAPLSAPLGKASVPAAGAASASGDTNRFITVTSESFEYQPDRAVFRGHVKAHDEEGDLQCGALTVLFRGESGELDKIQADGEVILEQGETRAFSDRAIYQMGQGKDQVEFSGHAVWQEGLRQGSGERILFDRATHLVRVEDRAYLKLPRGSLGQEGFLSSVSSPGPVSGGAVNTNEFVEVFSKTMLLELSPTNGPVRHLQADGSVLIVDPSQQSRALADTAVYDQASGRLELTGSPMLQSQGRLVTGRSLRVDQATRMLTAAPDAYVKLPLRQVGGPVGALARTSGLASRQLAGTNDFIEVWAAEFDYRTNFFHFEGDVRANVLRGPASLGQLTCGSLIVEFGERLQSVRAQRNVRVEQRSAKDDPNPTLRRVHCERLEAGFSAEGYLRWARASEGVTAEEEERRAGQPDPIFSRMTSEKVTAFFSGQTNRAEKVTAERNVEFSQGSRSAHAAQAVYEDRTGLMEMTGQPSATMPEGRIWEADRLVWDRAHQRFITVGKFKSEWKRTRGQPNPLAASTAKAP